MTNMRRPWPLFAVGVVLLLASTPMLWQQAQERYVGKRAYARYNVNALESTSTVLNGRALKVDPNDVNVAGRLFPRRPNSAVALLNMLDTETGKTSAMVVEWSGGREKQSWHYRIFLLSSSGAMTLDEFKFEDRGEKPYRVLAARFVSPEPVGFRNESLQQWPGLLYPLLYPWLTAILGVLALVIAAQQHYTAAAA